jgi:hypothetical protein
MRTGAGNTVTGLRHSFSLGSDRYVQGHPAGARRPPMTSGWAVGACGGDGLAAVGLAGGLPWPARGSAGKALGRGRCAAGQLKTWCSVSAVTARAVQACTWPLEAPCTVLATLSGSGPNLTVST